MTMFTRSDKTPDQPQPAPESARAPAQPERRPQATTQPMGMTAQAPQAVRAGVSVIGKSVKITGQIESTEDVQIDGQVDGDVRGVTVTVGSNARVKGTVYGETVEISGAVDGKVEANKVVLTSTARMTGDVHHADIRIDSGAHMDGLCRPDFGKSQAKPAGPATMTATASPAAPSPAPVASLSAPVASLSASGTLSPATPPGSAP